MNLRKDNKEKKPMQLILDEISGMTGVSQEMILSRRYPGTYPIQGCCSAIWRMRKGICSVR